MLTLPFDTGIIAALIFLIFELLVIPLLMHFTSTLASFLLTRRAQTGRQIQVRTIKYPIWSEGLLLRQSSHILLFALRIVCIALPVYLETRLESRSERPLVSRNLQHAFVVDPREHDITKLSNDKGLALDLLPRELFARCASLDDEGWLHARVVNVTLVDEDRRRIRCVKHTEQVIYRNIERLPPFVHPSSSEVRGYVDDTPLYQPNLTVKVQMDKGPFRAFPWWVGSEVEPEEQFAQVNSVTVEDTNGMQCFFWGSPLPASVTSPGTFRSKLDSFVCQNETGNFVDYYGVSTRGLLKSNERVLRGNGSNPSIVSTQFTVSTTFKYLGSLQFKDRVWIHGGHLIRRLNVPAILTRSMFQAVLQQLLYERATNVSISLPGDEEKHSVQLDDVVVILGSVEVGVVILFALLLALYSRYKKKDIQRVNTVDGLSQCWAWDRAATYGTELQSYIVLRLRRTMGPVWGGDEANAYEHVELR